MPERCAIAARTRGDEAAGTASTVRAFLLVENPGPWGVDAVAGARMPEPVRRRLQQAAGAGVRVLLARRHRPSAARGREGAAGLGDGGTRVLAAYADPHRPWLETATLDSPADVLDLDLAALGHGRSPGLGTGTGPVFGVCTHGRHDACCAELGRPTAAALAGAHREQTWEVSHIGGDRFAANVLVLPDGLYYGRVPPDEAAALGSRHLSGHLDLDLLRGRSGFAFPVQAAEIALRRQVDDTRVGGCRLVSARTTGAETEVRLDLTGASYVVQVRRTESPEPARLTCRAARESVVPRFEVLGVHRLDD